MSTKKFDMSRLCSCRFTLITPYHNQPQTNRKTGETRGRKSVIQRLANHSPNQALLLSYHMGVAPNTTYNRLARLTLDSLLLEAKRPVPSPQTSVPEWPDRQSKPLVPPVGDHSIHWADVAYFFSPGLNSGFLVLGTEQHRRKYEKRR
jgi:hypothetical protein